MLKIPLLKNRYIKTCLFSFIYLIPTSTFFIEPATVFAKINTNQQNEKQVTSAEKDEAIKNSPVPIEQKPPHILTFQKLGIESPIVLRGIESEQNINFKIRSDEVVSSAKLNLSFYYSKQLLSELSQINILMNGEPLDAINIEDGLGGQRINKTIEIPKELVTDNNVLTFQLIAHYSKECEDPRDSRLWSVISNYSTIEIVSKQFILQNDLLYFPLPFLDAQVVKKTSVPFVFLNKLGKTTLESAGILASYFGSISNNNNIDYPVHFNNIPKKGNAIVFLDSIDTLNSLNNSTDSSNSDSQLLIVTNPADQTGKLLLVYGKTPEDQKTTILNLISKSNKLSGNLAAFSSKPIMEKRRPYDSPAWLQTDGPVKFSQVYPNLNSLNATSYGTSTFPVDINLPPDLFALTNKNNGIKIDIKYSYDEPNFSKGQSAKFIISTDDQIIRATTLNSSSKNNFFENLLNPTNFFKTKNDENIRFLDGSLSTHVPVEQKNSLLKLKPSFNYNYSNKMDCVNNLMIASTKQSINPNSSIDISNLSHFIKMPNLAVFKTHGYPFSRMADLSDTSFIISGELSPSMVKSYLNVLGWFGKSIRFPAVSMSVNNENEVDQFKQKNLIIFNNASNNSKLLSSWDINVDSGVVSDGYLNKINRFFSKFNKDDSELVSPTQNFNPSDVKANILEFQSPLSSKNTVVLLSFNSDDGFKLIDDIFGESDELSGKVYGSRTVITNQGKYSLSDQTEYYLGSLTLTESLFFFLAKYPLFFVFFTVLVILFLSIASYYLLRDLVKKRSNVGKI